METKICPKCKINLPIDNFTKVTRKLKDGSTVLGKKSKCKIMVLFGI